ncbi:DUF6436 domain-containing protein [Dyadobacter sandarakinus]|uniref:Thioredoxin fold domain-containing protein n=1 Tax=Dyadobacter sandarakinus TaxID=2747268 RepID=A0ABX7I406_9BACT|nr:thioredoxin fold domain-containing protein [Dyadobacter sandarakinus]QRR00593.1 thioredoxin fold domain-containing protein [Dyadobacter sandarakinus]
MFRKGLVMGWLVLLFTGIATMFWYYDWIYKLPTPIPENYQPVVTGSTVDLGDQIQSPDGKPVFVHFYNPDCPCSRFNKKHFKSLVQQYGRDVHFVVVVMSEKTFTPEAIRRKMGVDLPVLFDKSIADRCGVYSTPQAALLDQHSRLYYRGNFNASRYCSDEKTAYAKLALAGLLNSQQRVAFGDLAQRSYGCSLPVCKN